MWNQTSKIAILGAGSVGSAIAYALILNPIAGEILLVDPKEDMRDAQVQDLSVATDLGHTSTRIRAVTPKEAGQCDIVVFTAGAKQQPGESRTDLIGRNKAILEKAIGDMKPFREDTILLLVANPVEVLTHLAQGIAGLPKAQVLGTGTFLDSTRLRETISQATRIPACWFEAVVLGEHGESQFVAWSQATFGGVPLAQALSDKKLDYDGIAKSTKDKAANIINVKGMTNYGIGAVTASICKSILNDSETIHPVSHWMDAFNCCLSMPAIIGREGIIETVELYLDEDETAKLANSAACMRKIIEEVEG